MHSPRELDHAVWYALNGPHAGMARVAAGGLAARYPASVSPLGAVATPEQECFEALRTLVQPGESVALFMADPVNPPAPWKIVRSAECAQMVGFNIAGQTTETPITLTRADVPEMLALTAATRPGPFLPDTITMGHYVGFRSASGRLVAMAGERLQLANAVEISAVCTDPEHRGHGYASRLVSYHGARIIAAGRTPFLHVGIGNPAQRVYEKAGFVVRRSAFVTVITPE